MAKAFVDSFLLRIAGAEEDQAEKLMKRKTQIVIELEICLILIFTM